MIKKKVCFISCSAQGRGSVPFNWPTLRFGRELFNSEGRMKQTFFLIITALLIAVPHLWGEELVPAFVFTKAGKLLTPKVRETKSP